jgi:hypothetical protein
VEERVRVNVVKKYALPLMVAGEGFEENSEGRRRKIA